MFYRKFFSCEISKLRKTTFSFVTLLRLFSWNNSAHKGRIFMKFYIWELSENLSRKFKLHLNLTRITGTLHEDQYTFSVTSGSFLLRMRHLLERSVTKIKTYFMFSIFFSKILLFKRKREKICRAGQATDDNMAHAHCMLDTWGNRHTHKHTHTHRICNAYFFSTATVVARNHLSVTLNVHCLSG